MNGLIHERRRDGGFSVIGGPTVVIDMAGRRIPIIPAHVDSWAHFAGVLAVATPGRWIIP